MRPFSLSFGTPFGERTLSGCSQQNEAPHALLEQKQICQQQGRRFKDWIAHHCPFSHKTATTYMRVAENWGRLEEVKRASPGEPISIREAMRLIEDKQAVEAETAAVASSMPWWIPPGGGHDLQMDDISRDNSALLPGKREILLAVHPSNRFRWLCVAPSHRAGYYVNVGSMRDDHEGDEGTISPVCDNFTHMYWPGPEFKDTASLRIFRIGSKRASFVRRGVSGKCGDSLFTAQLPSF